MNNKEVISYLKTVEAEMNNIAKNADNAMVRSIIEGNTTGISRCIKHIESGCLHMDTVYKLNVDGEFIYLEEDFGFDRAVSEVFLLSELNRYKGDDFIGYLREEYPFYKTDSSDDQILVEDGNIELYIGQEGVEDIVVNVKKSEVFDFVDKFKKERNLTNSHYTGDDEGCSYVNVLLS